MHEVAMQRYELTRSTSREAGAGGSGGDRLMQELIDVGTLDVLFDICTTFLFINAGLSSLLTGIGQRDRMRQDKKTLSAQAVTWLEKSFAALTPFSTARGRRKRLTARSLLDFPRHTAI